MKREILKLLKESDGFVSGEKLCKGFSVSRTAVWKAINQLRKEGYEIEAIHKRGYRLLSSPDRITKEELGSCLLGCSFGEHIIYEETIDSTNTELKRQAEAGIETGTLVVADCQLQGKGRQGRPWSSPKGQGIFFSFLLRPSLTPEKASALTLAAALSVSLGIEKQTGLSTGIKWPNDVVVNGKKVCGILTEMSSELDFINYVVIGIGINVNTEEFPPDLPYATSLKLEGGKPYVRSELLACILREFEGCYQEFLKTGDMSLLLSDYNKRLVNYEKEVKVLRGEDSFLGVSKGINEKGELLVETKEGLKTVVSGEVSVRGIYGYV
jgi:BirA family biotin operon repressor/biotin-[acetyl-CoA-carboxylase] ligase